MFSDQVTTGIIQSLGQAGFACLLIYLIVMALIKTKTVKGIGGTWLSVLIMASFAIITGLTLYRGFAVDPPPLGSFVCKADDREFRDCTIGRGVFDTYELRFASPDSNNQMIDNFRGTVTPSRHGYLVLIVNYFQPDPASNRSGSASVSELRLQEFRDGRAIGDWTFANGTTLRFIMEKRP